MGEKICNSHISFFQALVLACKLSFKVPVGCAHYKSSVYMCSNKIFAVTFDEFNFPCCDIDNPFLELMQLICNSIKDLLTVLFVLFSIWTIDLGYLLLKYKVKVEFTTVTLGVDDQHAKKVNKNKLI